MQLTLNQIKKNYPCTPGWNTLLTSLNKTHADDDPLELMDILKSNGLDDAVWCLRCLDYKDYCLFLADIAESVLPFFEQYNSSQAPRKAVDAIRQYKLKKISQEQLNEFANAATIVADDAAMVAATIDDNDSDAAADAADAAADAADSIVAAASVTASNADVTLSFAVKADTAALHDRADTLRFKKLFEKHFAKNTP